MLSDQFAADALYQAGLWKNENLYFLAQVVKPAWKTVLESTVYYVNLFSKNSYAIINRVETGIAILPIKIDNSGVVAVPELSVLLLNEDIAGVEFKASFLAKRVVIKTKSGKPSSFIVEAKNRAILQHERHFSTFMSIYS